MKFRPYAAGLLRKTATESSETSQPDKDASSNRAAPTEVALNEATHEESPSDAMSSQALIAAEETVAESSKVREQSVAESDVEKRDSSRRRAEYPERDNNEALLIELARKDPHAFAGIYEAHVDRIYAYIYHRVGNAHDAEDLTARTFYRALDRLDKYEDRGLPFSAWLFRIAHNLVANWHRDRQRRRVLPLDKLWGHSSDHESPEHQVEREQRANALWEAIDRLPDDRRNLLLFKFGGQLSNVEIGEMLNRSESAIKSLYFRTLGALREDLEARGWGNALPSTEVGDRPEEENDNVRWKKVSQDASALDDGATHEAD